MAQQLYQRLINEDQVDLLFAPYTTAVGGAVIPITERAGKLVVNAGFVGKEIHMQSELLVSTWPYQDNEYPRPLFEWIKSLPEDQKPQTLAIATAQNPFTLVARDGVDGEGGVLTYAEEAGLEVVVNEEYDQTATDLSSLIQRIQQSDADVFVALSLPNDAALIANTVHQAGYNPQVYCQCGSQVTTLPNWPDMGEAGINVFSTTTAWPTQDYNGLAELTSTCSKAGCPHAPRLRRRRLRRRSGHPTGGGRGTDLTLPSCGTTSPATRSTPPSERSATTKTVRWRSTPSCCSTRKTATT